MESKLQIGDKVQLAGRRNYRYVRDVNVTQDNRPIFNIKGMRRYCLEKDVEFVIPKGTNVPVRFADYSTKPLTMAMAQDPAAVISGLRAALEASAQEQVQLRKRIKGMEEDAAYNREERNRNDERLTHVHQDLCRAQDKAARLQKIVTAFVEGKL